MKISKEKLYREQATLLINKICYARDYLKNHKPSLGYYGEFLILKALQNILPNQFKISQGFIVDSEDNWISNQCDIIIYNKDCPNIKTFGDIKLIEAKFVFL